MSEQTTQAIVPVVQPHDAAEPPAEKRLTVFARNPQEMSIAQGQLIQWCIGKMGEVRSDIADLQENYDIAVKSGWKHTTLKRQIQKEQGRIAFYEKVKAALAAGYCIVPTFPIDIFAIRTERSGPARNEATGNWTPAVADQRSESPALGLGEYVSPQAAEEEQRDTRKDEKGIEKTQVTAWADAFLGVDFPFSFAQPAVLTATQQAMACRVFDELGVSPARHVKADPMVIGRIYAPGYARWQRDAKSLSFVVAWFLRPDRDLDF